MKHPYIFHHHHYYHTLKSQIGGGYPIYSGTRQRGGGIGGILGFFSKYALPLISKYIIPHAKEAVFRTASDVAKNKSSFKEALKTNTQNLAKNIGKDIFHNLTQTGKDFKRKGSIRSSDISLAHYLKPKRLVIRKKIVGHIVEKVLVQGSRILGTFGPETFPWARIGAKSVGKPTSSYRVE